jgi:hypothetical protein
LVYFADTAGAACQLTAGGYKLNFNSYNGVIVDFSKQPTLLI